MGKFEEANARLFKNIFVCKTCKRKIRSAMNKVLSGKASCRKCNDSALRPKRKK